MKPSDYLGCPVTGRQGQMFVPTVNTRNETMTVMQELSGHPWDSLAMAYVQGLRPSELRVIRHDEGEQLNHCSWRVTVWLNSKGRIRRIEQEIQIGVPDDENNGLFIPLK